MNLTVVDLDDVLKVWTYFLHHTLDINWSGSELIIMYALTLYHLLNLRVVNVGCIIVVDMDEMSQTQAKKYLGHAYAILLLCRKTGVPEFTDGRIVNPTWPLDIGYIKEHHRRKALVEEGAGTQECPIEPIGSSKHQPQP